MASPTVPQLVPGAPGLPSLAPIPIPSPADIDIPSIWECATMHCLALGTLASAIPALFYCAGGILVLVSRRKQKEIPIYSLSVLLCLSGGLLYGALTMDLLTTLRNVQNGKWYTILSAFAGYILGVSFMYFVNWATRRWQIMIAPPDPEEDNRVPRTSHRPQSTSKMGSPKQPLLSSPSNPRYSFQPDEDSPIITRASVRSKVSASGLARAKAIIEGEQPVPKNYPMLVAGSIHTFVAGSFVGCLVVNDERTGWIVSGAMAIGVTFLAITITLQCSSTLLDTIIAVSLPTFLTLLGGLGGSSLKWLTNEYPAIFAGILSFAIGAILFMVGQELLREAFERHCGETPAFAPPVDSFVLIGFGLVFLLNVVLPPPGGTPHATPVPIHVN